MIKFTDEDIKKVIELNKKTVEDALLAVNKAIEDGDFEKKLKEVREQFRTNPTSTSQISKENEVKKKKSDPVYNTQPRKTGRGQWYVNLPHGWKIKEEEYYKKMTEKAINPDGKRVSGLQEGETLNVEPLKFIFTNIEVGKCCENPQKYKNIISANLQFYACKNCGADLGDC